MALGPFPAFLALALALLLAALAAAFLPASRSVEPRGFLLFDDRRPFPSNGATLRWGRWRPD